MIQLSSPKLQGNYPILYSFITFRKEKAGGLLFNPYLFKERWIDEYECFIVAIMNGRKTLKNIIQSVARQYNLELSDAERIVRQRLQELEKYYAINWKTTPLFDSFSTHQNKSTMNKPNDFSTPLSVIWDITYRCNLRCKHCLIEKSASGREMGITEAKKVIDELKKMQVFNIIFSGGEPLIRHDIFDIIQYASDQHFGIYLNSNGLLLTDRNLKKLNDLGVSCIQISLDGLEETHDKFRGKRGAYKKTCDAIKRASKAGFYTIMSTTLTYQNMDEISSLLEKAILFHVSSFKINGFVPAGRGKLNADHLTIPKEMLQKFSRTIMSLKEKYRDLMDIQIEALYPWLLQPEPSSVHIIRGFSASPLIKCSAGHSNLVIAPDGTVFACPYLTSFPLGNILDTPLQVIWNNQRTILSKFRNLRQQDLSGACKTCSYVPEFCNGGCRALAYNVNGDLFSEDPSCWIQQKTGEIPSIN